MMFRSLTDSSPGFSFGNSANPCDSSPAQWRPHSAADLLARVTRNSVGSPHPAPHTAAPVCRVTSEDGPRFHLDPSLGAIQPALLGSL